MKKYCTFQSGMGVSTKVMMLSILLATLFISNAHAAITAKVNFSTFSCFQSQNNGSSFGELIVWRSSFANAGNNYQTEVARLRITGNLTNYSLSLGSTTGHFTCTFVNSNYSGASYTATAPFDFNYSAYYTNGTTFDFTITCTPPDLTPPTATSAATNTTGDKITINFSEDMESSYEDGSLLTVKEGTTTIGVTGVTFSGTTAELTLATNISAGTTVTVAYEEGNYTLVDAGFNDCLTFTLTVTNNVVASGSSPTVTTTAASAIKSRSATLGGNVTADGGASVTARGVVYSSADATPTIGEPGVTQVGIGTGAGAFSQNITGLTLGTTYYFNSYATNTSGTAYGTISSFIPACDGATEGTLAQHEDISNISVGGEGKYLSTSSSCRTIALVSPSGGSPVSGAVNGKVWVRNTVPTFNNKPFVPRSYEITPVSNAATATGTVTLYFTQTDFDAYNATYNGVDLPYNGADAESLRFNARIYKFSGTSSDGTGMPGSYTQPGVSITPSSVVWNATMSRWEVTFTTTGFSGFFLGNVTQLLPIVIASFEGKTMATGNAIQWQTSVEENAREMQLERSADGLQYTTIASIAAKGKASAYRYTDAKAVGTQYYRLKLIDKDGSATYSHVLKLQSAAAGLRLQLFPNPVSHQLLLTTNAQAGTVKLYNVMGNVVLQQNWKQGQSISVGHLPAGSYIVELSNQQQTVREKVIKK
jgi:Secretion system C-terminal sorting domain/Putative flagellar system-associated repeat